LFLLTLLPALIKSRDRDLKIHNTGANSESLCSIKHVMFAEVAMFCYFPGTKRKATE